MSHLPILKNKVTQMLITDLCGIYVDCTIGLGGHSFNILNELNEKGLLIGLDLDPYALNMANKELSALDKNYSLHNTSYENFPKILSVLGVKKVNGFLFDLGISSYQVDSKHRGFSYMNDGDLDMRFNPNDGITAKEFINEISENELISLLKIYGQVKHPKLIAKSIIRSREKNEMLTTFDLRNAIMPISNSYKIFSKVFQAIRIGVNNEIETFKRTLIKLSEYLLTGGRIAIITFHSIEDRIVKHFFRDSCIVDEVDYYSKQYINNARYKLITKKPICPDLKEIKTNKRARSAKLRIVEKI